MVGGHACVAGVCAWPGGVRGWGCMAGGMCGRGHVWQGACMTHMLPPADTTAMVYGQ